MASETPKYVLAIDLGTSSVRAILFNDKAEEVSSMQQEYPTETPGQGLVEQDALKIWEATKEVLNGAVSKAGASPADIAALGITNQRETTVLWDKTTGIPYHNALVWCDTRTAPMCSKFFGDGGEGRFRDKTGLPIIGYFSATKIRWLLDNVPDAAAGVDSGNCLFGTMDTWLVWKLTGGKVHVTDVTNASRTLLMNISTLEWDAELCDTFGVPKTMLPEIKSSSEVYGACEGVLPGVSIAGILGDQQSAMFGQACFDVGQAKNTYGTGAFTMMNTGTDQVHSSHGLLTTVGYKLGSAPTVYALEGSVAVCGALIKWLRDNLGLFAKASETEAMARSVPDTGGVTLVPAFSGLFAPYWRADSRGVLVGLTSFTNKKHIVRAALEAAAFQTFELIEAMEKDLGRPMTSLRVDGGMVKNALLMQFQASLSQCEVVRPEYTETTALGAAYAAGLAVKFWGSTDELRGHWKSDCTWTPEMSREERDARLRRWRAAVEKTHDLALGPDHPDFARPPGEGASCGGAAGAAAAAGGGNGAEA